jgi:phosphoribosylaminoimidazole carboxylase (NCAIR synthetase)
LCRYGAELFHLEDGRILLNEIAPRPHNSGTVGGTFHHVI